MKLALKIDVLTLAGLREAVPLLLERLERHGARATFFFAVGPDRCGRGAFALPPGPAGGLHERSGLRSLLYGTLVPGPDLGRRGGALMRSVRAAGCEAALAAWDAIGWRRHAAAAGAAWTEARMQQGIDAYTQVFGEPPLALAAPGWQTNVHALRATQRLGIAYCSDGRGRSPHLPVVHAELIRCPQIPTTLPLLDECLALPGMTPDALANHVLALTGDAAADAHVFNLRAEVEARHLARTLDQLFTGWRAQGYDLVPLATVHAGLEPLALPRCETALAPLAGRASPLLQQGEEFLADVELSHAA